MNYVLSVVFNNLQQKHYNCFKNKSLEESKEENGLLMCPYISKD